MENRNVGIIIVIISLLVGFITLSFNQALTDIVNASCSHGTSCPMWGTINFQTNVSIGIMSVILLTGLYLIFFSNSEKKKIIKTPKNLKKLEKKVFNLLKENQGSMFQSEIVEKTKLSKVKITRLLDKLEGKSLLIRKRRGMSNMVILKQ